MNFPNSPTLNQTYSYGGRTWKWNGDGWELVVSNLLTGYAGANTITTLGTVTTGTWNGSVVTVPFGGTGLSSYTAGDFLYALNSTTLVGRTAAQVLVDIGALAASSYTAADVLAKLLTVDGSGSGVDADTLDGVQGAAFAQLSGATFSGNVGIGVTPTATLQVQGTTSAATNGIIISNTTAATSAKIWLGNSGNYEGYLKFNVGTPATQNDWDMAVLPGGINCKTFVSAPQFASSITGRGDSQLLLWTNTGGNFNGKLTLGQDYPNGTSELDLVIGPSAGLFRIRNNSNTVYLQANSATSVITMPGGVAATNSTTGTLVVTGGVGVSGALYTGGLIAATGAVTGSNLSGTNTGDQTITLTGNVTGSGTGSFATTIAAGAVTLAMQANLAANSFVGNNTGSAATPSALTVAQAKTLLALVKADVGLGNVENTALSTWTGSANITTLGTISSGSVPWARLTSPPAATASGLTMATARLLGRTTAAAGAIEEISIGSGLAMSAGVLSSTTTGTVTSVSVVTANGVSGSVATNTTTPALTLTLGAITPTSVAATGTVTGSNLSGTNTGDQTITLTSDVTGTGTGSFATTIAAGAVSLAKMASLAANSIIGNNTGAGATPIALTAAQVRTLLNVADGATANAGTVTAVSVATANGVSGSSSGGATPALTITLGAITPTSVAASGTVTGSNLSGTHTGTSSGTNSGDQTITLTGNVTGSGTGSFATTIAANAVTLGMMAQVVTATFLGRTTAATGNVEALTTAQAKTMLALVKADVGLGAVENTALSTWAGSTNLNTFAAASVTLANMANVATGTIFYRKTAAAGVPEVQTLATLKTDLGLTGTNSGDQTITLTGNVTGTGTGSFATTIAAGVVTLANLANIATNNIIGRSTAGTGVPESISIGSGLLLSAGVLSSTATGTVTAVSVVTANGVSGSSSGGATPALTISLGAITPTSVAASGTVTGSNLSGTHTGTSSGTNTGDQTITLTGNVTGSGTGSFATTIAANAVTLGMMAQVVTATFLGRTTAATGNVEALTTAQAKTLLALVKADVGLGAVENTALSTWAGSTNLNTFATASVTLANMANVATGTIFYRKTAAAGVPEVQTLATLKTDLGLTGTNSGDQTITLTGNVTGSGTGSFATTIAANAVTLGMMAQVVTATFLGRTTAATGNVEALTTAQAKTMLALVKADVGLGAVENTALSTWAGTTSITSVGTIATGTWNATAIADGKIASALTGKTYNALTLTALATGFSVEGGTTSKTLTVTDTASIAGTHTGTSSGSNTGDQTITLTGNVTGSGTGSFATTIASGVVTLANMANIATNSIIGRSTAGTGVPESITIGSGLTLSAGVLSASGGGGTVTAVSVATANGVSGTSSGGATPALTITLGAITPSSVAASGTVTGSNLSGTHTGTSSGTNTGDQTITLTSDVTGTGTGSFAATIAANAVTLAKMADIATASFIGRNTAATGDPEVLSIATAKTMLNLTGTNSGDQTTVSGNAGTATTLQNARTINGTSFNGSANITTANWGTSRTLTMGLTGKAVDGSAAVSWSLAEMGALPLAGGTVTGEVKFDGSTLWLRWNTAAEKFIYWTQNNLTTAKWRMGAGTAGEFVLTAFDGAGSYAATPITIAAASGAITIGGQITVSGGNFVASSTQTILATTGAGTVYLRPNGVGSSTGQLSLSSAGVATAADFSATSDARLKTNITTLVAPARLRPVRYIRTQTNAEEIGFIAQEVEENYPELVTTDVDGFKSVSYGKITAVLAAHIESMDAEIKELRALVTALLERDR